MQWLTRASGKGFLILPGDAADWIWDLLYARQFLYLWATFLPQTVQWSTVQHWLKLDNKIVAVVNGFQPSGYYPYSIKTDVIVTVWPYSNASSIDFWLDELHGACQLKQPWFCPCHGKMIIIIKARVSGILFSCKKKKKVKSLRKRLPLHLSPLWKCNCYHQIRQAFSEPFKYSSRRD